MRKEKQRQENFAVVNLEQDGCLTAKAERIW